MDFIKSSGLVYSYVSYVYIESLNILRKWGPFDNLHLYSIKHFVVVEYSADSEFADMYSSNHQG